MHSAQGYYFQFQSGNNNVSGGFGGHGYATRQPGMDAQAMAQLRQKLDQSLVDKRWKFGHFFRHRSVINPRHVDVVPFHCNSEKRKNE